MNSIPRNLVVTCPRCGNKANYSSENPWRPFCSERCQLIDLGKWASEEFKVPTEPQSDGQIQSDEDSNVHENDDEN